MQDGAVCSRIPTLCDFDTAEGRGGVVMNMNESNLESSVGRSGFPEDRGLDAVPEFGNPFLDLPILRIYHEPCILM